MAPLRRLTVVSLFLGSVLYQVVQLSISIVLPKIQSDFGASPGQLGLIVAGFPLGVGVFAFLSGVWVSRLGPTRTVVAGLVVLSVGAFLCALTPSAPTLFVARLVAGAGVGTYFPVTVGLLAANTPESRRAIAVGLLVSVGLVVGGPIGFLGGAFGVTRFGWRVVLGGMGLVAVLVALVAMWSFLRQPLSLASSSRVPEPTPIFRTLRNPRVWALNFALLGTLNAGFTAVAFLPTYIVSAHSGWGLEFAGTVVSVALVLTLPGGLLGGWAAERGRDRRVVLAAFGAPAAVLFFLIPYSGEPGFAVVVAVAGLLLGAVLAILFSMPSHIPEMSGAQLPTVVGTIDGTRILFSSAYAVVFGVIVGLSGYPIVWALTSALGLAFLPALVFVPANRSMASPVGSGDVTPGQ